VPRKVSRKAEEAIAASSVSFQRIEILKSWGGRIHLHSAHVVWRMCEPTAPATALQINNCIAAHQHNPDQLRKSLVGTLRAVNGA